MWVELEEREWSFGLHFGERERRRRLAVAIVGAVETANGKVRDRELQICGKISSRTLVHGKFELTVSSIRRGNFGD